MLSDRLISAISLTLLAALGAACAPASDETGPADSSQTDDLAASSMLSATAGDTTVRLERTATIETREGRDFAVVRGSASRDLDGVFSFVPDDAFGTASLLTKRKFEVLLELGSELNSIASGLPLILRFTPKNTAKPTVFAHFVLVPELSHFSGASALRFDQDVRPVYFLGAENPLRYRGAISATSALSSLAVDAGANDPATARVDADTFRFDWTYDALEDVLETRVAADAVVASGAHKTKSAELGLGVRGLEATTEDPYDAWPNTCDPDVWACVDDARASDDLGGEIDLGHCGDYRDVQHCIYADACEVNGPSPFALEAFDATDEVDPSIGIYDQGCAAGGSGTWCDVSEVAAYSVPACLAEPASLDAAIAWLAANDQSFLEGGTRGGRAELEATSLFGTTYSAGGPALLLAIDVLSGGGEVEADIASDRTSCQNCSTFADQAVLFYPTSGVVVVVRGSHGYDS